MLSYAIDALHKTQCDSPAALTNFDGAQYMGTWFEQVHVKNEFFQTNAQTCVQAQYSNLQSDGSFTVANSGQDKNFDPRKSTPAAAKCPDTTGQCYVAFYGAPWDSEPNYIIVDTDYSSYSIVYSCHKFKNYLWILSREDTVSDAWYNEKLAIAQSKLPNYDFSTLNHRDTQGSQCTYAADPALFWDESIMQ